MHDKEQAVDLIIKPCLYVVCCIIFYFVVVCCFTCRLVVFFVCVLSFVVCSMMMCCVHVKQVHVLVRLVVGRPLRVEILVVEKMESIFFMHVPCTSNTRRRDSK